jgi:hypothetical protein
MRAGWSRGRAPLFTFDDLHCVHRDSASRTFRSLVTELEFPVPEGTAPPRLHCLRHSFAVGSLLRWYREGIEPSTRLLQLATFMGHVDPSSTAVYLTITPELLSEASDLVRGVCRARLVGGKTMNGMQQLGPLVHSFFIDHLVTVKGLRPASVRSYGDTIRLLLCFVAAKQGTREPGSPNSPSKT